MDPQLSAKLEMFEKKIDAIYESAEKTRKYFLIVVVVTIVTLVLPLIGLIFAIPQFISMTSSLGGL